MPDAAALPALPPAGFLSSAAAGPAAGLLSRQESLAVVESSSGGLLAAMLTSVPGASRFLSGSLTVYSANAAKALLPKDLLHQLGRPEQNYASPEAYRSSKETFTLFLARHARERFGATWAVAEAGAAEAESLPKRLRPGGAFSVVAVVGPGIERVRLVEGGASREANMWAFALAGLELLGECLATRNNVTGLSKL
ncbi:unnamed protein product [Polarella glacialis]|uniref:CinA C-terminal domain-containing protein n=1 Tax=Polarella glacialis TaxID=89957 RepID=A0A813FLQ0_POLGL|nr:unnamed protein product [Polarella glacialis]